MNELIFEDTPSDIEKYAILLYELQRQEVSFETSRSGTKLIITICKK